jgi:hypothetical protein
MENDKYSMTQGGNLVAMVMFLTELFKLNITGSEVETVIKGIVGVIAVLVSWYGRWRKGDITVSGFRK